MPRVTGLLLDPFFVAALLTALLGIAHSWLGERYVISRLLRRQDLPKLFGSDLFTRRTIRFAWHLTSIAWFGFAVLLFTLGTTYSGFSAETARGILFRTFALSALVAFVGSRGRHLAWIVMLAIALLVRYAEPLQAWALGPR